MKHLKVVQYILSFFHICAQAFYFYSWQQALEKIQGVSGKISLQIQGATLSNINLQMNQVSFLYLMLAVFTLAFYMTVTAHVGLWTAEARLDEINRAIGKHE
ncbi:MAG: hypothetical protein LWY06_02495 [Firmicutes bacterium]|nr:hypothetical protein [Bacillota bacterium]